ncbi:MAG: accessory Sec system protein Asp3 [Eubacteriales bacterium]|nr:accessory Sec system protein Asp3 [Eubacteriales bacterium]
MQDHILYTIRWDGRNARPYLYGSTLKYMEDGSVIFENELLPPGAVVNEWTSFTDFQRDRREPQLPILKEKQSYRIQMHCWVYPEKTLLWKIDFFDAREEKLDFKIFDTFRGEFTVPEHTYFYKISLIQAGSQKLRFYWFDLTESEETFFEELQQKTEDLSEVNVLIPQIRGAAAILSGEYPERNYANATAFSPGILMYPQWDQRQILQKRLAGAKRICFWGRGASGRALAEKFAEMIPDHQAEKRFMIDE